MVGKHLLHILTFFFQFLYHQTDDSWDWTGRDILHVIVAITKWPQELKKKVRVLVNIFAVCRTTEPVAESKIKKQEFEGKKANRRNL
jgi:hypothetical protein